MMDLRGHIGAVPDYPKKGIIFRDVTTLMQNGDAFAHAISKLQHLVASEQPQKIVGIEARGFIFGAALAQAMNLGFVPVRKQGKLPREVHKASYELEYGQDVIEVHRDALEAGNKVVVVDDLIATGGTALACGQLMEMLGVEVTSYAFVIDLPELGGADRLRDAGHHVHALVDFEGH
jgi:adenine phosphoribosyltransferase